MTTDKLPKLLVNSRGYPVKLYQCGNGCGPEFITTHYIETNCACKETLSTNTFKNETMERLGFLFELMWEVELEDTSHAEQPVAYGKRIGVSKRPMVKGRALKFLKVSDCHDG